MLFYRSPIDLEYILLKSKWFKIFNFNNVLKISSVEINNKINIKTFHEAKLFDIYKHNVLYNFYRKNRPYLINEKFVNSILYIIKKLDIEINQYEKEVINYWNTILLANIRRKKELVVPIVLQKNEKAFYRMDNISLIKKKNEIKKKNFLEDLNEYKLIIKGTLYFTNKRLIITNNKNQYYNFYLINIRKLKINEHNIIIVDSSFRIFIMQFPYNDTELFNIYYSKII